MNATPFPSAAAPRPARLRLRRALAMGAASLAFGIAAAAPAAAQAPAAVGASVGAAVPADCAAAIGFRLWVEELPEKDQSDQIYSYGQDVPVASGDHAHVYVQAVGQARKALGTSAVIGYPGEFGFGGTALEVLKRVRMEAQNPADRQYGRIRLTAAEEGGTSLGFRLEAVDAPGRLEAVAAACRVGQINLRILPARAPANPEPQVIAPREAAEQLVVLLYYGLLRRKIVDQFDQGYVEVVEKERQAGVERIAETILESNEFRESAYRRAEERHGTPRRGGKSITELLLGDFYNALYGRSRPDPAEVRRDLEDLDVCLKGKSYYIETCGRLGRTLVASPLFYQHNKDLLDALGGRPGS